VSKELELKHVKACAKKITGSDKPRKLPPAQAKAVSECAKQFMPPTHTKAMLEAAAKQILEANHQKADAASVKKLMSAHSNEVTEAALKGADAKKAAARKRLRAKAAAAHKKVPTRCPFRPHTLLTPFSVSTCRTRISARGHTPCPAARCQLDIVGACALTDLTSRLLRSAGLNARTALFFSREKSLGAKAHLPQRNGVQCSGVQCSGVQCNGFAAVKGVAAAVRGGCLLLKTRVHDDSPRFPN
jgi:hypothetical protein